MIALFANQEVFDFVKSQGTLPSGVALGEPMRDTSGRCATAYDFTEADITYLTSFANVQITESLPEDWTPQEDPYAI